MAVSVPSAAMVIWAMGYLVAMPGVAVQSFRARGPLIRQMGCRRDGVSEGAGPWPRRHSYAESWSGCNERIRIQGPSRYAIALNPRPNRNE